MPARYSDNMIEAMAAMKRRGMSGRVVARELGVSPQWVDLHWRQHRDYTPHRRPKKHISDYPSDKVAVVWRMMKAGASLSAAAKAAEIGGKPALAIWRLCPEWTPPKSRKPEFVARVMKMIREGFTSREVGDELGFSDKRIREIWHQNGGCDLLVGKPLSREMRRRIIAEREASD